MKHKYALFCYRVRALYLPVPARQQGQQRWNGGREHNSMLAFVGSDSPGPHVDFLQRPPFCGYINPFDRLEPLQKHLVLVWQQFVSIVNND